MNTLDGHPDQEAVLINRIGNGDEQALEKLYHSYYHRLSRFIGRTTWREDVVDEVINDVMYTVWIKATTYNYQCQPSTWIFGIAYNKLRQALRDKGHANEDSLDDMDTDIMALAHNDTGLMQLESNEWIDSILKILSPAHRAVIELTYCEGLHYSEIALLMDCPENTVKTRMHYAKKLLASHLKSDEAA